jgi:hypothetical protein
VKLVAGLPAAMGVLDGSAVAAGGGDLKVLRIDGKTPGDDGYPLVR